MAAAPSLILASTSRYRAELLGRLGVAFRQRSPSTDEAAQAGETARQLAARLAKAKAADVGQREPQAWVIGSDQVASCEGRLLGKPGGRAQAIEQLLLMRGRSTRFVTAITLSHQASGQCFNAMDTTLVRLRKLTRAEIERYVDAEPAFDCAGSAKIEGLGIALCAEVQSRDPTALIGLPLIDTARLLRKAGFTLP